MFIEDLTWQEFEKFSKTVRTVIIPLGPLEEHGPHLPLGTDYLRVEEFAKIIDKKSKIFIYPTLAIGNCYSTKGYLGTMSVSYEVLNKLIYEISSQLVGMGIKKLIILSGHSGQVHNAAIKRALYEIKLENPGTKLYYLTLGVIDKKFTKKVIETTNDMHAGETETSEMLVYRPELVKKNMLSENYWQDLGGEIILAKDLKKINKNGVWGNAKKASLEKGKKIVNNQLEKLLKIIKEK